MTFPNRNPFLRAEVRGRLCSRLAERGTPVSAAGPRVAAVRKLAARSLLLLPRFAQAPICYRVAAADGAAPAGKVGVTANIEASVRQQQRRAVAVAS